MHAPYRIAAVLPIDPVEPTRPGREVVAHDAQKRSVVLAFVGYGLLAGLFPVMIFLFALAPAPGELVWFATAMAQVLLGLYASSLIASARRVDYARAQELCWTLGPATLLAMLLVVCVICVTLLAMAGAWLHFLGWR